MNLRKALWNVIIKIELKIIWLLYWKELNKNRIANYWNVTCSNCKKVFKTKLKLEPNQICDRCYKYIIKSFKKNYLK